jgi:tetratricopeptide (TPR) repeat protein
MEKDGVAAGQPILLFKLMRILARVMCVTLLVGCSSVQLPAQQSEADRKLLDDIRAKAERGDADFQCEVGFCYANGKGVATNYVEAVKWYRKAAEQNHATAQNNLGLCYANGQGVATNYVEAAKWIGRAAEQGFAEAQFNLGVCYHDGQGVATNYVEAVKWYRKAAEQCLVEAQVSLGYCYAHGQGVAKDEVEGFKWYRKAAESGEACGLNAWAWLLATSENSAIRDGPKAVGLAEKAVAATSRKEPTHLGTLAAAFAEAGQFEQAVKAQQEAIALLQTEAEKNDYRTRLKLYETKVPYRAKD